MSSELAIDPVEVAPALRMIALRTPTLPPATHTNAFLVGSREAVLVEPASPYADELERVSGWVEAQRAREGLALRAILLTHHHPDHVGGAAKLRERLGIPLWAHDRTAQRLERTLPIDRVVSHGERIALDGPTPITLEAVHTPGHAPGHLCFFARESRALIAGDMVAGVGTILVEPNDGDMSLYLQSLEAMHALAPSMLLPAHGGVIHDASQRLRFYFQHRLAREAKVLAALRTLAAQGERQASELVPLAYDDAPRAAWPLAAQSAEAHLLKLVRDGKAERTPTGYRPRS